MPKQKKELTKIPNHNILMRERFLRLADWSINIG